MICKTGLSGSICRRFVFDILAVENISIDNYFTSLLRCLSINFYNYSQSLCLFTERSISYNLSNPRILSETAAHILSLDSTLRSHLEDRCSAQMVRRLPSKFFGSTFKKMSPEFFGGEDLNHSLGLCLRFSIQPVIYL